jgi:hypothetical protein
MEAVGAVGNGWLLAMHERVEPERIAGAEGGAEWIRGRVGLRGLGTRVDSIDCIDLMDGMDLMDVMVSGVGGPKRGTDGRQGEGSGKKEVRSEKGWGRRGAGGERWRA